MTDNTSKLIKSEIKGRRVIYYLTTEEDLQSVKSNSLLGDIFALLASLTAGGIISVILTRETGIQLRQETVGVLNILFYVFAIGTIIFGCFAAFFYSASFKIIQRIKGSGEVKSIQSLGQVESQAALKTENQIVQEESKLEIIKATYWTQKEHLDVTEELRGMIVDNRLDTVASNAIKGDPDVGKHKKLSIQYKFNSITITKEFTEGDKVLIP